MMDPISGRNRGYCFVTFTEKKAAEEAVKQVKILCFLVHNIGMILLRTVKPEVRVIVVILIIFRVKCDFQCVIA